MSKIHIICLSLVLLFFVSTTIFKIPVSDVLFWGTVLACPLLHIVIMKDHHGEKGGEKHETSSESNR